jgi:hypothetical protein
MNRLLSRARWRRHRHAGRPGPHPDRRLLSEQERRVLLAEWGLS